MEPAPFSDEPLALANLANCNYSDKITVEMAKSGKGKLPFILSVSDIPNYGQTILSSLTNTMMQAVEGQRLLV